MALLNLDKIVLNRTVVGAGCPVCGNALNRNTTAPPTKLPWWLVLRRRNVAHCFECQDCGKAYWLIEKD
ncbi:MAG: hypothetical protein V4616_07270 [Bacteroidota bacterium]